MDVAIRSNEVNITHMEMDIWVIFNSEKYNSIFIKSQ